MANSKFQLPSVLSDLTLDSVRNQIRDVLRNLGWLDHVEKVPKWVWITGSLLGAAGCYKLYYDRVYGVWKKQGVPGPTPLPIFGTTLGMATASDFFLLNDELVEKYGHKGYVGLYNGSTPVLLVSDPDLIAEVMIKQFDAFPNRVDIPNFQPKYFRKNVSSLRNQEWKRIRKILSPTFTGSKLKNMTPFINEIGGNLCEKFEKVLQTESQEFELKPMFRACTMDIICNIVFGISVDSQSGESEIAQACMNQTLHNEKVFKNPFMIALFVIPGLSSIYKYIDPNLGVSMEAGDVTAKIMLEILQKRQEGKTEAERTWFLNTLVEKFELHQQTAGKEGMDFETTVAQALIFLLAGFDTTANLMMWVSFYLARYPDIQDQVYEEIVSFAGQEGEDASYENVNKMQLLDNFVMETLRWRPVFRTQRTAEMDVVIGPGIKIKKGWSVEVPVNTIHMDQKIWKDPKEFRPSRFDPEEVKQRSPYVFNAFGVGPRNCIGMRLALFEVKMAFVKILTQYKLSMAKNTPEEVTGFLKTGFYDPLEPLFLKVDRRH